MINVITLLRRRNVRAVLLKYRVPKNITNPDEFVGRKDFITFGKIKPHTIRVIK